MSDESKLCYIGRADCGCVVAAIVVEGVPPLDVLETLREWDDDYLTMESATLGEARAGLAIECTHEAHIPEADEWEELETETEYQ